MKLYSSHRYQVAELGMKFGLIFLMPVVYFVCGVSTLSTKTVVPSCSREGEINGVGEVT